MFAGDLVLVRPAQTSTKRKSGMVMEMRSWAEIERIASAKAKSKGKSVVEETSLKR